MDEDVKVKFGKRIRELRKQIGLSQESFALKIDMDRTYYASVELGIASILTVAADIKLENPNFNVKTWPSNIEAKYNKVLSWYSGLSDSKKADFDANYMNKPLKGYTMVNKVGYF